MSIENSGLTEHHFEVLQRLRDNINDEYLRDEAEAVRELLDLAKNDQATDFRIEIRARNLVDWVRDRRNKQGTLEAFIHEYSLSSEEGVVLMCLAEALLRIPDNETVDRLIRDKIAPAEWQKHKGVSRSLFVNASTWGLMLTGSLVNVGQAVPEKMAIFSKLVSRIGEPVVRTVLRQAMKLMGSQYVMGTSIETAVERSQKEFQCNYRFSFDMLGEAALSSKDADVYYDAYLMAIRYLGNHSSEAESFVDFPSISIKLSALHPRYEIWQKQRVLKELVPRMLHLVEVAREKNVAITIDAEESDRLDLSLEIFQQIKLSEKIRNWDGFGLAVQAYQKRAYKVLQYLLELSKISQSRIPIRLVKGAYWDTEIKRAQESGLESYPVFTRKSCTDVSYLACAKFLLSSRDNFYPQFATHNAHTIASVVELANGNQNYEFQRLHGMGENLYASVIDEVNCRVYAPVGSYEDLLPYLVRRLLENGANSSFVHNIEDESLSVDHIVQHPVAKVLSFESISNPSIPIPKNLFRERVNSLGENFADQVVTKTLLSEISAFSSKQWRALVAGSSVDYLEKIEVLNPANKKHIVGHVGMYSADKVKQCLSNAVEQSEGWKKSNVTFRISTIKNFANILQEHATELYALMIFEAGKTVKDAASELREAIDFCHYYSEKANHLFIEDEVLPGPTGEKNCFQMHGRGLFVCISPWNFPLAIFTGQIVAALLSGNVVIAKPSTNTMLIAWRVIELLHKAGIPENVLQFLPCSGSELNQTVLNQSAVDGVVFTGSFNTASLINQTLASRKSAIVPFIAETGGLNAMIVDSSALPEQVVKDVITSAFNSAGQRCSALRVLILQKDIHARMLELLMEAMLELKVGNPLDLDTDVPSVIDANAQANLNEYKKQLTKKGKLIFELDVDKELLSNGYYVTPAIFEIDHLSELMEEQFGPILHVMSFESDNLMQLVEDINQLGYGLTLGVHSRINETINFITEHANVGNLYVNRNIVGAVVGVQPFGGEGLSGTGPKAGGPNYLQRFCGEKTISINTAAVGGNASLLALNDD